MRPPKLKELPPQERVERLRHAVAYARLQPMSLEVALRMSIHLLEKRIE